MVKTTFDFDKRGNLTMDMGDLSDPKFKDPIIRDLIKKTWDDMQRVMDRSMILARDASDGDLELEVFIKNSLMVSCSTNAIAQCVNFMIYSRSEGRISPDEIPTEIYMEQVINHLSLVAQVIMKGHINDQIIRGKSPVKKKPSKN